MDYHDDFKVAEKNSTEEELADEKENYDIHSFLRVLSKFTAERENIKGKECVRSIHC